MDDAAAKYLVHATTCAATEYGNRLSLYRHNRAADAMRKMVARAYKSGTTSLERLYPLLSLPPADSWLAFQLLDLGNPPPRIRDRCLEIIRRRAAEPGPEGMGAAMWLTQWLEHHPDTSQDPTAK